MKPPLPLRLAILAFLLCLAAVSTFGQSNDVCSSATVMEVDTYYVLDTTFVPYGGDPLPTCQSDFGAGVWYSFTPASNGIVTISTCGSDYDTVLQVYSGTCAALTPVACDDDDGPACYDITASVSFSGTAGTTYLILAGGYFGDYGLLRIVASVAGAGPQPNLTPARPPGWSDKIVVCTNTGSFTDDSPLLPTDMLYLNAAVSNVSSVGTLTGFTVEAYVDDVLRATFNSTPLGGNSYTYIEDFMLGSLPLGTHTIRVKADAGGAIAESDETDNEYTRTIMVGNPGPAIIRVTPLSLSFSNASGSFSAPPIDNPGTTPTPVPRPAPVAVALQNKLTDAKKIMDAFTNGPMVSVVVDLGAPESLLARTVFSSPESLATLRTEIHRLQQEVLDTLPAGEVKVGFRYDNLAAFSAEVTLTGLQALQAHSGVTAIEPVFTVRMHLAQGIPLIHGMTYRSTYNGSNMSIAICDTGIDYTHPRLGGGGFPNAKVIGGYDFGDGDGDPLPNSQEHGTCCAGIAAGDLGTVGDYIGGVAYGAKLYALKISPGTSGSASSAAMTAAWDWCVTHKNDNPTYPIMVISTSFGGGRYYDTPTCDAAVPSMTTAAHNAAAAGITVLASSGNDGYCDSLAWPACISGVISVGAVYDAAFGTYQPCVSIDSCAPKYAGGCSTGYYATDSTAADKVTSYSNASTNVVVLAPGNKCYTTDIVGAAGETTGDYADSFGGTSAACPYAAGAVASLQAAAKALTGNYLSPAEVRNRLTAYGDNITDTKVALTKPRVNLANAIESLAMSSQSFRIYNDGGSTLTITSIVAQSAAPWITTVPTASFTVPALGFQDVAVNVNWNLAPRGTVTNRLLIGSSVGTNSPYAGGVYVVTINGKPLSLSLTGWNWSNGVYRFVVNGPAGSNCVIQASSNLMSWTPTWTGAIGGGGTVTITDTNAASRNRRFYRALLP